MLVPGMILIAVLLQTPAAAPNLQMEGFDRPGPGQIACQARLHNLYTHRALTWVVTERGGGLTWYDNATSPGAGIPPAGSTSMPITCPALSADREFTMAAVQYDNGEIGGDSKLFERTVQRWRRAQLEELESIESVLKVVGLIGPVSRAVSDLHVLIGNISPRAETFGARTMANEAVDRAAANHPADLQSLRARLLVEIDKDIDTFTPLLSPCTCASR